MVEPDHRALKKRGTLWGTAGLLLALLLGLALRLVGLSDLTLGEWGVAVVATLLLQAVLWVVLERRWDAGLRWDPHFLHLPSITAFVLIWLYVYLAPEGRVLALIGWFVVLLFGAGLAGFLEVLALSGLMVIGYVSVIALVVRRGEPISFGFEVAMVVPCFALSVYAGYVLERLRRNREEMKELRRELSELALTDMLTGLPNRRRFEETLGVELARCRRHGNACAVGMIDIDHFKSYNDRLGHLAGDTVLRELAAVIRAHLRVSDLAARYGGDEFGVILADTSRQEALASMDRLRKVVELHRFHDQDLREAQLTVSAGVAGHPEDPAEPGEMVGRADRALYLAKSSGRNRVCGWQADQLGAAAEGEPPN